MGSIIALESSLCISLHALFSASYSYPEVEGETIRTNVWEHCTAMIMVYVARAHVLSYASGKRAVNKINCTYIVSPAPFCECVLQLSIVVVE